MPSSIHTASVIYKVYIYLPTLFGSGTLDAPDLVQTSLGENSPLATSLSNAERDGLNNTFLNRMIKQTARKQD
jgi:hypothetical protein